VVGEAYLLDQMPAAVIPNSDKGYDTTLENLFSLYLYRNCNAIERRFGRLKDRHRIATRYDRHPRNFLAAVRLVATRCYRL
jgi:transposase